MCYLMLTDQQIHMFMSTQAKFYFWYYKVVVQQKMFHGISLDVLKGGVRKNMISLNFMLFDT